MKQRLRALSLASVLVATVPGTAMAYYINCAPNRTSLFHMAQYGSFYVQRGGRLSYQYFNDMQDKKTVDPRCTRLLGAQVPLYAQPAGF